MTDVKHLAARKGVMTNSDRAALLPKRSSKPSPTTDQEQKEAEAQRNREAAERSATKINARERRERRLAELAEGYAQHPDLTRTLEMVDGADLAKDTQDWKAATWRSLEKVDRAIARADRWAHYLTKAGRKPSKAELRDMHLHVTKGVK